MSPPCKMCAGCPEGKFRKWCGGLLGKAWSEQEAAVQEIDSLFGGTDAGVCVGCPASYSKEAVWQAAPLSPAWEQVVEALPYTALIWFGCYSLGTISINILTFRECPEAAAELLDEIKQARSELSKKGVKLS